MPSIVRFSSVGVTLLPLAVAMCLGQPAVALNVAPRVVSNPGAGAYEIWCGDQSLVRLAEKGAPYLSMSYCLHKAGDTTQPQWIEPKVVQSSFDFKSGKVSEKYDLCQLAAVYELKNNRLECSVSLQNTSDSSMEFNVRVLGLKTLLNYWNCEGEWFGTSWGFSASGCKVGVFVHGDFSGEYRKVSTDSDGFAPLNVKNRGPRIANHPVVESALLSDPGTLVAPGKTADFKVSLTFANEQASDLDLFSADYREIGRQNPMALSWPDRRPIGTAFISQPAAGWPTNPRGYIVGLGSNENVFTPAGLAAFGKSLMSYADRCIVQLKDKHAQGVIIWDLEGQEMPQMISYVGDPRKLAEAAPEMDRFADAFMKKFSDAGFRTGLTIRPTEYYKPDPGKPGWAQRDVKDPVALMSQKIEYANKRWGTTLFYLDSNVFSGGQNVPWVMPASMIQKLQEAHPNCLIIPEWSSSDYYRWSAPYSSPNIGQLTTNYRDQFARVKWPGAFGVVAVEMNMLESHYGAYVDGVTDGDILLFRCWFADDAAEVVKLIDHEADMRRKLAGTPKGDLARWLADSRSPDEVTRYGAARSLAGATDPRALAAAAALLDDPSLCVRRAALETIKAQGKVGSAAVIDKLVSMLKDDSASARLLRQSVADALSAQGEAAAPVMLAVLADPKATGLRLYAVRCIGESGTHDPAAAKAFLDLFARPDVAGDRDMMEAVIRGLGHMQVKEALPGLLGLLAKDEGREREWVRVAAIRALGDLGDRSAIPALVSEYKHPYSNVQVYEFRERLYDALTQLTGQKNEVWPSYDGWKKWLAGQAGKPAGP